MMKNQKYKVDIKGGGSFFSYPDEGKKEFKNSVVRMAIFSKEDEIKVIDNR